MEQRVAAVASKLSLEEYLQHISSLCGEKERTVRALNDLEKKQFHIAKLKEVDCILTLLLQVYIP